MTSKERMSIAMDHREPDRVPIVARFVPEAARLMKARYGIAQTAATATKTMLHSDYGLDEHFGHDMIILEYGMGSNYYRAFDPGEDTYTTEWGITWKKVPYTTRNGTGYYTEIVDHPIKDQASLAGYTPPDPREENLQPARDLVARYGRTHYLCGHIGCSTMEALRYLRGFSESLVDLAVNKELAHAIMDLSVAYHLTLGVELVKIGVDMIWLSDDLGGEHAMLISPDLFREMVKPKLERMTSGLKAHNENLKIAFHSDGYIEPIIEDLIEIGIDILNPIQPESMNPATLKQRYGHRLALWGSVSTQTTLPFGSAQDVRSEVRERIRTCCAGGGFILSPTHAIQLDVPIANIEAFYEAAREYGNYPRTP